MNDKDFLARAQVATQRVVTSAAVQQNATPEQTQIVQELAQDRPTIHNAVTAFLSLVAARSLVTPDVRHPPTEKEAPLALTNAEALTCSRALLKAINATTVSAVPIGSTGSFRNDQKESEVEEEYALVAQLWNGLIASEQKPSRFLGRRALKRVWPDVKMTTMTMTATNQDEDKNLSKFVDEFERLLFFLPDEEDHQDDDAALIWDPDGGKAELQRRRDRREKRAKEAASPDESSAEEHLPVIEELSEDNEEPVTGA